MRRVLPSILAIALLAVSLICVSPASAQYRGFHGAGFRARIVTPFIPSFAFVPAFAVQPVQLQAQVVQQTQVLQAQAVEVQPAIAVAQTVLAPSFASYGQAVVGARFAAGVIAPRAVVRIRLGRYR